MVMSRKVRSKFEKIVAVLVSGCQKGEVIKNEDIFLRVHQFIQVAGNHSVNL